MVITLFTADKMPDEVVPTATNPSAEEHNPVHELSAGDVRRIQFIPLVDVIILLLVPALPTTTKSESSAVQIIFDQLLSAGVFCRDHFVPSTDVEIRWVLNSVLDESITATKSWSSLL